MDNGMIGKIEKAKRYAEERDRMQFQTFSIAFQGENGAHQVGYHEGVWSCDCNYFKSHRVCSHMMALERVLDGMVHEHDDHSAH